MVVNILVFVLGLLVGLISMGIYTLVKVSKTMMTLIDDYKEMLDSYNKSVDTPLEIKAVKIDSKQEFDDFMNKLQSEGLGVKPISAKELERKAILKRIQNHLPNFEDDSKEPMSYLITVLRIFEEYKL